MKHTKLVFAVAAFLSVGCAFNALAADPPPLSRVDFSAMGPQGPQQFDRFIVKYRGTARSTQVNANALMASIDNNRQRAFLRANAAAPEARYLRTIAGTQSHVIRLSRKLERGDAQNLMLAIAADPNVEMIVPDVVHRPDAAAVPNDPMYASQWHYNNATGGANVTAAWDAGAKGRGVVVAVLDTGVTQHSDLAPNLLPGYDFISDREVSGRTTDERVPGGADLGDWVAANQCGPGSQAGNSTWHGTHVSGTIAEVTNNGIGGAGIANEAKIVPVRVLGHCGGMSSDIFDAITWASGGHVDGVPDNANPAEVINMSLSGTATCDAVYQQVIDAAVARGTTIVAAAGNNNTDAMTRVPASCKNVITVGSNGIGGKRAYYSNYGSRVDVSAPGGGVNDGANQTQGYVWSTWNAGTTIPAGEAYVGMVGTSMAAPHVAGIVAMVQGVVADHPKTPAEISALLKQTARAFPSQPDQLLGAGIVDAGAAVVAAATGGQVLPNGVVKANLAAKAGESFDYVIVVASGAPRLTITSYGGSGEVKLLLKRDTAPSLTSYDAISQRPGNNQVITVNAPAAGTYYLKVLGTADFSRLSLKAAM